MALPLPPAPTTTTRTGLWRNISAGSVCSIRMLRPLSAHELRECLGQGDQGFAWKRLALISEAAPQPLEASIMPCQSANISMGKCALVKAALPFRYGCHGGAVGTAHRAGADNTVSRKVPEGSNCELCRPLRTFVLGQRPDAELSVGNPPYQGRLGKDASIQISRLPLGVLIEHLPSLRWGPPCNHAVPFGEDVLWQHLGRDAAAE